MVVYSWMVAFILIIIAHIDRKIGVGIVNYPITPNTGDSSINSDAYSSYYNTLESLRNTSNHISFGLNPLSYMWTSNTWYKLERWVFIIFAITTYPWYRKYSILRECSVFMRWWTQIIGPRWQCFTAFPFIIHDTICSLSPHWGYNFTGK